MKYILKNNYVILYDILNNKQIIINFNNDLNNMVINTFNSIDMICNCNFKENYIININKYNSNDNHNTKSLNILDPAIKVFNIDIYNYISSIKNKLIKDLKEIDKIIILCTSNSTEDIYNYIKKHPNLNKDILNFIKN